MNVFWSRVRKSGLDYTAFFCRVLFLILALVPGSLIIVHSLPEGNFYYYTNYLDSEGFIFTLAWFLMMLSVGFGVPKPHDAKWISAMQAVFALLIAVIVGFHLWLLGWVLHPPFLYVAMPVLAGLHLILSVGAVISKFWNSRGTKK